MKDRVRPVLLVLAALVGPSPATWAAETGSVCVHHYSQGVSCFGSDAAVTRLAPVTVLEDCASGDPATAEAVFDVRVSAAAASCYDVGVFLALDGGSALSGGTCLHDYLEPPLEPNPTYGDADGNGTPDILHGPWWNGEPFEPNDECGDLQAGTESIKSLTFRFACTDTDLDGIVDVSTCTSWTAGTSSRCQGLSEAYPPSGQRCNCGVVSTGVPMPGSGTASGRVAGLTVSGDGLGGLLLSWGASCSATDTDYGVYEGALGDFTGHQSVACTTGGTTSAAVQPASGDRYYLVVPRTSQVEGSYGEDGAGVERPAAAGACRPQSVAIPCS